jgi:hypothetical protein
MKEDEMNEAMNHALTCTVSIGWANITLKSNRSPWKINSHFDLKDIGYAGVGWFKSDRIL